MKSFIFLLCFLSTLSFAADFNVSDIQSSTDEAVKKYQKDIDDLIKGTQEKLCSYISVAEDLKENATLNSCCGGGNINFDNNDLNHKGTSFYSFVSLSMPESTILAVAFDAKIVNSQLVLRGLVDNSYKKTVLALKSLVEKTRQNFMIDPNLFTQYKVDKVPTFVVARDNQFDKLSGNVTWQYILDTIKSKGELKTVAKEMLESEG